MYNAARMPQIISDPILKEKLVLNKLASRSMAFSVASFFGNARLMITIKTTKMINTSPILLMNGISGSRNLKAVESTKVSIAAHRAALAVTLFQKMPTRKIATTPGDTKPVYSWMN